MLVSKPQLAGFEAASLASKPLRGNFEKAVEEAVEDASKLFEIARLEATLLEVTLLVLVRRRTIKSTKKY